jgi:uridine phosphorylase
MRRKKYPILEFDPERRAVLEASELFEPLGVSEHCVMCYYKDVVERTAAENNAKMVFLEKGVYGTNPYYQFVHEEKPVVFFNPIIGAATGAAFMEIAIALGCRKFIACGSAGVLDRDIAVGEFVIPNAAIRDEGTSYHYLPAARQVDADPEPIDALESTLKAHGEAYRIGKIWTTDGLFRETRPKIAMRKKEGCLAVDMEAAALFAVAQYRKVALGYLLSGGDDVSGDEWDRRPDKPRTPVSEKLFWLSVEACLQL